MKGKLKLLKKRLKQPLDKISKERVKLLIKRLEAEIPALENALSESEQEGTSSSDNGTQQSEESGQSGETGTSGTDGGGGAETQRTSKPGIPLNDEVVKILGELNNVTNGTPQVRKIQQLYDSLTTISVRQHTCLAHIGTWALWETIGFALRSNPNQKAWNYLTQSMSNNYKKTDPQKYQDMQKVLQRVLDDGNMNKHSPIAVGEDGSTLKNYMEILDPFLLDLIEKLYEHLTGSPWRTPAPTDNS